MMRGRISPREANRMMARMGMQMKTLDDVTKVIFETPTKKIIIDNPEVSMITVQGQSMYQVGGNSREEAVSTGPSDDDVKLVASQAGVSIEQARNALRDSGGDLAQAIILLKQKK
jgi:nascent polypeptide-associated complex subunit alpha